MVMVRVMMEVSAFNGGRGEVDEGKKVAQVKKARLSNLVGKQPAIKCGRLCCAPPQTARIILMKRSDR